MRSLNFIGGEKGGVGKSVTARLLAQYARLDATMGKLDALNSYVSQQVSQWNRRPD